MRFDRAMSTKCGLCSSRAAHHRMTKTGRFYCLVLNKLGARMRDTRIRNGRHWDFAMIHHLPVKYLQRSDIDQKVGQAIITGLTTMEEEYAEEG